MVYRKLIELKKLEDNPRVIKDKQFKVLCDSIRDNPKYFEARPLILSNRMGEFIIIAGNQRYEAAKALKLKEAPTFLMEGITEEKEREITIRDNTQQGEWDMDLLSAWDNLPIVDWGVSLPEDWLRETDQKQEEKPTKIDPLQADGVIMEEIEKSDKIIFQFSGGRDSSLAILKTLPLLEGKDYEALYVDTGVEIPKDGDTNMFF